MKTAAGFLLLACAACAQPVRVYSEFQRVDPLGRVVAADRAETPREILSPGLARNAFASFLIAVTPPPGRTYSLFIAQNPVNAVKVSIYRAGFVRSGASSIPDTLGPLTISAEGLVDGRVTPVPGQSTQVFWLDLWVAEDAPVRRTRLEVQLHDGERWTIYPLELRTLELRVPRAAGPLEALAPLDASSAESARAVLCGGGGGGSEGPLTIRQMIRRNARQDAALARTLAKEEVAEGLRPWCHSPAPPALGAEWYLQARGFLYRAAMLH